MATTGAEQPASALFIDTNVLVYANVSEAPQHQAALAAIDQARKDGRTLWISRQVLREYLVTLTRPQGFQDVPLTTVLEQIRLFQDHFEIADDTDAVTDQLMQLMDDIPIGGKQVHDANIVATMLAHGIPALLTHNGKDFERFADRIAVEAIN
jgi:predicted nucleic acid-binding protein